MSLAYFCFCYLLRNCGAKNIHVKQSNTAESTKDIPQVNDELMLNRLPTIQKGNNGKRIVSSRNGVEKAGHLHEKR
jgi:hypothetical protein